MLIRKQYKFEGAHIVRNCSSQRCAKSIHGHSYLVEVMLHSPRLDLGHMTYDFGLMKSTISALIDSFDHATTVWNKDDPEYIAAIHKFSDRVVTLPCNPTAEQYARVIMQMVHQVLKCTRFANGEDLVSVRSVRVHETATGWAEATLEDFDTMPASDLPLSEFGFSKGIREEWYCDDLWERLLSGEIFENPLPLRQVQE